MRRANRDQYHVLVLEDNIALAYEGSTNQSVATALKSIATLLQSSVTCDVLHLGYMMYVPALRVRSMREEGHDGIVQLFSTSNATAVGTSAYIISAQGVRKLLQYDAQQGGYVPGKAIPNVMAEVFPDSRYALYPMLLHRSGEHRLYIGVISRLCGWCDCATVVQYAVRSERLRQGHQHDCSLHSTGFARRLRTIHCQPAAGRTA
jgi:hypothetical protein